MPPSVPARELAHAAAPPVRRFAGLPDVVDAVVTTRRGGVSEGPYATLNMALHVGDDAAAVVENRRRAAATVGLSLDDLVLCRQVHGASVVHVDRSHRGRGTRSDEDAVADADAMVTTEADLGLVVMVADCAPIVLVDPEAGVLACAHAGWRGTVGGVVAATVTAMAGVGARPERIHAGIGPAVAAQRYQVGGEVASAVRGAFGSSAGELLRPDGADRWTFDLAGANRHALTGAGVPPHQVSVMAHDTAAADLFSDRERRPCGRFALVARLRG